jgi:hypothetical protein
LKPLSDEILLVLNFDVLSYSVPFHRTSNRSYPCTSCIAKSVGERWCDNDWAIHLAWDKYKSLKPHLKVFTVHLWIYFLSEVVARQAINAG